MTTDQRRQLETVIDHDRVRGRGDVCLADYADTLLSYGTKNEVVGVLRELRDRIERPWVSEPI